MLSLVRAIALATFVTGLATSGHSATTAGSIGITGNYGDTSGDTSAPLSLTLSFSSLGTSDDDGIFSGYSATSVGDIELSLISSSGTGEVTSLYGLADGWDGTAWKIYTNDNDLTDIITFDMDESARWSRVFDTRPDFLSAKYRQSTDLVSGFTEYTGLYTKADGSTHLGTGQLNATESGSAQTFQITQTAFLPAVPEVSATGSLAAIASLLALMAFLWERRGRQPEDTALAV
jgi:hypothetical protein